MEIGDTCPTLPAALLRGRNGDMMVLLDPLPGTPPEAMEVVVGGTRAILCRGGQSYALGLPHDAVADLAAAKSVVITEHAPGHEPMCRVAWVTRAA